MTRIVFLTALTALVGCKKDDCVDTGNTGACDTGAAEAEPEPEPEPESDSCTIGVINVCIEATEPDNEAWCNGLPDNYSASYSASPCSQDGLTGTCALPAGGDYTAPATGYYYDDAAADEAACTDAGGTWTAA